MDKQFAGSRSQVNLIKGYAILAVVSIHFIHAYINRFSSGSFSWQLAIATDQITRFCVPIFVALSGFALAKKYSTKTPGFFHFLTSRAIKILPAYLVWSAIYYLVGWFIPSLANFSKSASIIELAVFGRAQYHLYFVPMIFQLYLLFPFLLRLIKKFPLITVLISLILQIYLYSQTGLPGWSDQKQYIQFSSWLFYFVLGIYLGTFDLKKYAASQTAKIFFTVLTLFGLIWTIGDGFLLLHQGKNLILATSFTRLPVLLFASSFFLLSFYISKPKAFVFLGKWSYQIYLGHVLFLQLLSYIGV